MRQDFAKEVRERLVKAMKVSGRKRAEIAADMNAVVVGDEVTKASLDSWSAQSRGRWRMPAEFIPAFELVTQTTYISEYLAECADGKAIYGDDVELLEIVKVRKRIMELEEEEKELLYSLANSQ